MGRTAETWGDLGRIWCGGHPTVGPNFVMDVRGGGVGVFGPTLWGVYKGEGLSEGPRRRVFVRFVVRLSCNFNVRIFFGD